jgi:hypothetical protein
MFRESFHVLFSLSNVFQNFSLGQGAQGVCGRPTAGAEYAHAAPIINWAQRDRGSYPSMIIIDLWDRPASPEPGPGTSGTPAVGPWAVWWGRLAGYGIRFVKNDNICLTSPLSAAFMLGNVNAIPWTSMDF